jgi:hypothetical protein
MWLNTWTLADAQAEIQGTSKVPGSHASSSPAMKRQILSRHNAFEDQAALQGTEEERLAIFRRVRNEIRDYLKTFRRMFDDSTWNEDCRGREVAAVLVLVGNFWFRSVP